MKWNKKGVIFELEALCARSTHAQVPTPFLKDADTIRIYYAGRIDGKSFPAYIDLDRKEFAKDKIRITGRMSNPIMPWGAPGAFDSDGIMPSSIITNDNEVWMYYIGWNEKTKTARYHNAIGIAVSEDGGDTFIQKFSGPIIDRTKDEPGLSVMPCVMYKNWYRMWYQTGTGWHNIDGKFEPTYTIKYAYSMDGIEWKRHSGFCIEQNNPLEAISNPSVICKKNIYHMWYCYRGSKDYRGGKNSYRIGYAMSEDGMKFARHDSESGMDIGTVGSFDNEMQCYPSVIEIDGRTCLFYNGNGFGQSGIGYAVLEQ